MASYASSVRSKASYPSETRRVFSFGLKSELCSKKAMFNLNENNRFVMSRNPMDLRKGVDSLCGAIRSCHLDPLNGDVYVFSNRSRTVLKLLHWERGGYTLYYKRLSVGRFHPKWPFPPEDLPARRRRLSFHALGRTRAPDGRHLPRGGPSEKIPGRSFPGGS